MNMGWYGRSEIEVIFNCDIEYIEEILEELDGGYFYDDWNDVYYYKEVYSYKYATSEVPEMVDRVLEYFDLDTIESIETSYNGEYECYGMYHNIKIENEDDYSILELIRDGELDWNEERIKLEMLYQELQYRNLSNLNYLCYEYLYG